MTADNIPSNAARPQDSRASVPSSQFSYQPLSTETDSTRFIRIEHASSDEAPVSCKLVEIAFGDRPRYEALSYRWGDAGDCGLDNSQTILLDSAEFQVGQNLYNALRCLRHQSQDKLFWIDAICIDQGNIPERNQQVRIMGQIYFRATTVIVWLGSKYTEFQKLANSEKVQDCPSPQDGSNASSQVSMDEGETTNDSRFWSEEKKLAEALLGDEYWNRLWIIQEIARARVLKVSFGTWDWTWDNFIHFLTAHNLGDIGPLKLNRQLRQVRDTGFPICQLFKDHHQAQCKDPKDKVYGLVGLAMDVCDFPIDYTKSLIEVWTDTMECLNDGRLLTAEEIVPMGHLIKIMLMGENCCPLDQVHRLHYEPKADSVTFIDEDDWVSSNIHNKKVFHVTGFMVGFIASIGPSTREIVAKMDSISVWQRALLDNFPTNLGSATLESNMLLGAIIESNDAALDSMCFAHMSNVRWRPGLNVHTPLYKDLESGRVQQRETSRGTAALVESEKGTPRLMQLRRIWRKQLHWQTGIASPQARPGDLVSWVFGTNHCVTIRLDIDSDPDLFQYPRMQIIGTAVLGENVAGAAVNNDETILRLKWGGRHSYQASASRRLDEDVSLDIRMDARTLFLLLD